MGWHTYVVDFGNGILDLLAILVFSAEHVLLRFYARRFEWAEGSVDDIAHLQTDGGWEHHISTHKGSDVESR
jgi:hypothetical protein